MAERRMFAKTIIDSDAFLEMPLSAQALYFHLSMRADDDGFVNNPKKILRSIGAKDKDFSELCDKRFIILFQSGVIVVKHWRIHNYIQKDRYKETLYKTEKAALALNEYGAYTEAEKSSCIQNVSNLDTQVSIGKDSIGEGSDICADRNKKTIPPSLEEVSEYCIERKNGIDPERFIDYYSSRGWMLGKAKMKDWRAAVRTWEKNEKEK